MTVARTIAVAASGRACRFALAIAIVLASLGIVIRANAQAPIPELHARVTDETATLTGEQIALLDKDLAALEARKGSQIAVLMIATLAAQPGEAEAGDNIENYAVHVFERWKLGRKGVDDGVLLVVVKNDRKVRIEVGYGLEGAIPDASAARIIREYITPRFREDDYFGGIRDATGALAKLIDGEPLPAPLDGGTAVDAPPPEVQWLAALFATVVVSLLFGFLLGALLQCLFNIFPVSVISIGARRSVGALAGPLILLALIGWVMTQDAGDADSIGALLASGKLPFGAAHFGVAAVITGWLGWSIAANGASSQWIGGMTWSELFADIIFGFFSLVFAAITDGLSSSGGSRGGGFSGGGGSSGGGGASGSW